MNNHDQLIYKKAKRRVIFHLVLALILLVAYFVGVIYVLNIDFLKINGSSLYEVLMISAAAQFFLFALIFLLLSFGKKIFRIFYWLGFTLTLALFYIPIHYALNDMGHILTYATLMGFMFIKTLFLIQLGSYLRKNSWSRIFYDWIIDVYEDEIEYVEPPVRKINPAQAPRQKVKEPEYEYENYYQEEVIEHEPYTQPQISLRLGVCIYASLMVFPIIVQIFSSYFSSYDLQTVFATKDIFMLCIFTALIWTISVFYLYYDHPYAKRIVLICLILEAFCTIFYLPKFFGYYFNKDPEYPIRVFILFALVDALRYAALIYAIKPLQSIGSNLNIDDM